MCNNRCPAVRRQQLQRMNRYLTLQQWSILGPSSWFRLSACSKILHQSGHQGRGRPLKSRYNKQRYVCLDDSEFYFWNMLSFAAMMQKQTTDQSLCLSFSPILIPPLSVALFSKVTLRKIKLKQLFRYFQEFTLKEKSNNASFS